MKPILVENVKQLNDLLPVLRKRVKIDFEDVYGFLSEKDDRMSHALKKEGAIVVFLYMGRFDCTLHSLNSSMFYGPTQSVSEYIQSNSPEIEGVESAGEVTNWEAKYKELEQGIKDAIAEMVSNEYQLARSSNHFEQDKAKGFEDAIEILTTKTGITGDSPAGTSNETKK